jgi:hypothetical protein
MEAALAAKLAEGQNARMAARYCWTWSDPRPDGSLGPDVRIGDWSRPWNLKGDRSVGDAPPAASWASDERGFGQVGCVYTAQGLEYERNGALGGPAVPLTRHQRAKRAAGAGGEGAWSSSPRISRTATARCSETPDDVAEPIATEGTD